MHIEIVFNLNSKKEICFCHDFLGRWEKLSCEKWKMHLIPQSWYVNSYPGIIQVSQKSNHGATSEVNYETLTIFVYLSRVLFLSQGI